MNGHCAIIRTLRNIQEKEYKMPDEPRFAQNVLTNYDDGFDTEALHDELLSLNDGVAEMISQMILANKHLQIITGYCEDEY